MNAPWWLPEKLDALYGAIAGGLIAFLSSFFTNRHALKRQRVELAHQAEQKEKERQHALKREIYVPVVEAGNVAVSFLAQIATLLFEALQGNNPIVELNRHVAKLSLVAPFEVMDAVHAGLAQVAKAYMLLTGERLVIHRFACELASIDAALERWSSLQKSHFDKLEEIDFGAPVRTPPDSRDTPHEPRAQFDSEEDK